MTPDKLNTLSQKQETFCLEYFSNRNATRAAIVAGYSEKTARAIAWENLTKPDIKRRLQQLRDMATSEKVMPEIMRKERLSEVARDDYKTPLTAKEVVGAITELNRMDGVYDERPQFNDNRQYTIVVSEEGMRDKVNALLSGRKPGEAVQGKSE